MHESARFLLICTVKDEGPNILEWVAYHRALGFTDIVIYENNSFDLTDRSLRVMARAGIISYYPNDFHPDKVNPPFQSRAYRRAARLDIYRLADWCMVLDADEYLQINVGQGKVADLLHAVGPETDAIRINWRVFGSSGHRRLDGQLVTEKFVHTTFAENVARRPHPVKTLFRPQAFSLPGIHLPKRPLIDQPRLRTGSGIALDDVEIRGFQNTDPGAYKFAQVNHYMIRDAESFLIKSVRGSSSHPERAIREAYWKKRNYRQTVDRRLADQSDQIRAAMAEVDNLCRGRLLPLRNRSLRKWQTRLSHLKTLPEFLELYESLV